MPKRWTRLPDRKMEVYRLKKWGAVLAEAQSLWRVEESAWQEKGKRWFAQRFSREGGWVAGNIGRQDEECFGASL
jgi:hypothetical protein